MVGAGFASGREIWQYLASYGSKAFFGIIMAGMSMMVLAIFVALIARYSRTENMGEVVIPIDNKNSHKIMKYVMAAVLFTGLINMSSAGGALIHQIYGLPIFIGNAVVVLLTVVTVLHGFEKMSGIFSKISPFLIALLIVITLLTIFKNGIAMDVPVIEKSTHPLSDSLTKSVLLFFSYNTIVIVSIISTAAYRARSTKDAVTGVVIGGILWTTLAVLLFFMLLTDPITSMNLDIPLIHYANELSRVLFVFACAVMCIAIYSCSSGMFYGFATIFPTNKSKRTSLIIAGSIGFAFSLMGFKNFIKYVLPITGVLGYVIITLVIINFVKSVVMNVCTTQEKDRYKFPEEVINVTTGHGSSALLFIGEKKTALVDCSMAYCRDSLVKKIKSVLGDRKLDYVLLSHSHYDHIGAMTALREAWPKIISVGSQHSHDVLERPGAHKLIKHLSEVASQIYYKKKDENISTAGMYIDKVVGDGDIIDLGGKQIEIIETPGHTKCSLSFIVWPMSIMLLSESAGVVERKGLAHPTILHSYEEAVKSFDKCESFNPERIIVSHYGIIPHSYNKQFWKLMRKILDDERQEIVSMWNMGFSEDDIFERMKVKYWYAGRAVEQPLDAFEINMRHTIRLYNPEKEQKN